MFGPHPESDLEAARCLSLSFTMRTFPCFAIWGPSPTNLRTGCSVHLFIILLYVSTITMESYIITEDAVFEHFICFNCLHFALMLLIYYQKDL